MELASGQILCQRFRIDRLIGQGGMGSVYLGHDPVLDREVAIKQLRLAYLDGEQPPEQLRRQFQREAQILANLHHPNLPRVTDHFADDGLYYLVMDYIAGTTLQDVLRQQRGGLDPNRVLAWADQLLSALEYIHAHNFIHRDIKPANIRLTAEDRVFLVDFGLVKKQDLYDSKTLTLIHAVGTLEYAPPEQYDPAGHTDQRSDLYALGATLYHLLSDQAPTTVSRRITEPEAFQPLRHSKADLSPEIEQVINRSMELSPEKRFATAADKRAALQRARQRAQSGELATHNLAEQPFPRMPGAPPSAPTRRVPRRAVLAGATALGAMLIVIASLAGRSAGLGVTNEPTSTVAAASVTQTTASVETPTTGTATVTLTSTLEITPATSTSAPRTAATSVARPPSGNPQAPTLKPTKIPPGQANQPTPRPTNDKGGNSNNSNSGGGKSK